jgi:hypothetical protein
LTIVSSITEPASATSVDSVLELTQPLSALAPMVSTLITDSRDLLRIIKALELPQDYEDLTTRLVQGRSPWDHELVTSYDLVILQQSPWHYGHLKEICRAWNTEKCEYPAEMRRLVLEANLKTLYEIDDLIRNWKDDLTDPVGPVTASTEREVAWRLVGPLRSVRGCIIELKRATAKANGHEPYEDDPSIYHLLNDMTAC